MHKVLCLDEADLALSSRLQSTPIPPSHTQLPVRPPPLFPGHAAVYILKGEIIQNLPREGRQVRFLLALSCPLASHDWMCSDVLYHHSILVSRWICTET